LGEMLGHRHVANGLVEGLVTGFRADAPVLPVGLDGDGGDIGVGDGGCL
jgi:hypothetical protein